MPLLLDRKADLRRVQRSEQQLEKRWQRNRRRNPLEPDEVIAWDGEGWGHPSHVYGLLANSLGSKLVTPRLDQSLRTKDILDLVWRTGVAHPNAYQVTYGGTYDWNHWIANIDKPTAEAIRDGHPVRLAGFEVVFNGIWFEVRKAGYWVTVWDVWKFWGCGFAQAVEENLPDFHGLPTIREFKSLREKFGELVAAGRLDEIIHYNDLELEAMVLLTLKMFKDLEEARIRRPNALTGAGALAGSLIIQHQITQHIEQPPDEVMPAVLAANFGGRIEAWRYGTGELWVHDLKSAYPFNMRYLPSLKGGKWEYVEGDAVTSDWDQRFSVWQIRWSYNYTQEMEHPTDRAYPFAYRDKGGSVLFPAAGQGWQWWPEVIMARSLGFEVEVLGGWVFHPAIPTLPWGCLDIRFAQRQRLTRLGKKGAARLIKYAMNAAWGKTSQARGYTADRPPPHHSLAWAGWVTSFTRASILEAASQDWDSVVYMMTDSVAATRRLSLHEGDGLGEWEVAHHPRAMVLQAGVAFMWDDKGKREDKFRGFDKDSISPEAVDRAWRANAKNRERAPLLVPSSRPVTLGSALTNDDWFAKWNTWQQHWRELDMYGGDGKRWAPTWFDQKPWRRMEPLRPWGFLTLEDMIESAPFEPRWEESDPRGKAMIDGVLIDIIDEETVAGMLQ
jgi:hypothetical protein